MCIGLPYSSDIWARDWPLIMKNTIEVCKINNSKLIFFDNVYLYGPAPLKIPFDETHPQNPSSIKGIARKKTADLLVDVINRKEITGLIGRSADFYGPIAKNSIFYMSFLENMIQNKNPIWLGKPNIKHTYAYTEDDAKALVMLALEDSCYNQVWHLPVSEPITVQEILNLFNKKLNKNFSVKYMPKLLLDILSIFIPILREVKEMSYQFDNDYILSDNKFRNKFQNFKTTSYDIGVGNMVDYYNK